MWYLVRLLDENEGEMPDLIPRKWVFADESFCFYPKHLKIISVINALAKNQAQPDEKSWFRAKIIVIERDIDDYEKGIRMLIKLVKNQDIHSDKDLGRGRRKKRPRKISSSSSSSDEDCGIEIEQPLVCPPPGVFPTQMKDLEYDDIRANQAFSMPTTSALKSATPPRKDLQCSCGVPHRCAFVADDQRQILCHLSAEIKKLSGSLKLLQHEVISRLDARSEISLGFGRNNGVDQNILKDFPIKSDDQLSKTEKQLEGKEFFDKVVSALVFGAEGKSEARVTSSCLRMTIDDDFAKLFSWKGQKEKRSFEKLSIGRAVIDAVLKKTNTSDKQEIVRSVKLWLAQSAHRIQRSLKKNNTDSGLDG